MKSVLRLSVSKPCQENWSDFTPVSGGGFCAACQKRVIDFTGLSDEEIRRYISGAEGRVCGRFRREQLTTDYAVRELMRVSPGMSLLKAGAIALFLTLLSRPVTAQEQRDKQRTEVVHQEQIPKTRLRPVEEERYWVKGVIRDKYDNSPIPGVNVVLLGATDGTSSDANGNFTFPVKLKKGDVLVVSFIGYETEKYTVPASTGETLVIELAMDYSIMGEIAVEGLYNPKKTLWSRIKDVF